MSPATHASLAALALGAAPALTPARCIRAHGNHLAAQNDEPEPGVLTEEQLLAIDRAYAADKSSGALAARGDRLALELQILRNGGAL